MNLIKVLTLVMSSLFISSCKNYYISVDSFKQQFAELKTNQKINEYKQANGAAFNGKQHDKAQPKIIKCTDKNGNPKELINGPSIETRITYVPNGKSKKRRTVFYFDTIKVTDSTVSGFRSRILGMPKTILLDSIKKIEVQNGGKKFNKTNSN